MQTRHRSPNHKKSNDTARIKCFSTQKKEESEFKTRPERLKANKEHR